VGGRELSQGEEGPPVAVEGLAADVLERAKVIWVGGDRCLLGVKGSVEDVPAPVAGQRLVARRLTPVPEPVVEDSRGHAELGGQDLAGVYRAGPDLPLVTADRYRPAGVDRGGEPAVITEDPVAAQDVG